MSERSERSEQEKLLSPMEIAQLLMARDNKLRSKVEVLTLVTLATKLGPEISNRILKETLEYKF